MRDFRQNASTPVHHREPVSGTRSVSQNPVVEYSKNRGLHGVGVISNTEIKALEENTEIKALEEQLESAQAALSEAQNKLQTSQAAQGVLGTVGKGIPETGAFFSFQLFRSQLLLCALLSSQLKQQ